MAQERFVVCGDVTEAKPPVADGKPVRLCRWGTGENVFVKLEDLTEPMWRDVPPVLLDLIDIAAYVYAADQVVPRGEDREADFGDAWRRRLYFRIGVREPDRWNSEAVRRPLTDTLSFLSDDEYHFQFVSPRTRRFEQPSIDYDADPFAGRIDDVALFSGGLDSVAGVVTEAVGSRRRVVLVHHRSNPKLSNRHTDLLDALRRLAVPTAPIHVPVRINKSKVLTREGTQRTRSFLYVALAGVLAANLRLDRVRVYENGVVALNLPPAGQVVGARATRTAHPRALRGFETILSRLLDRPFSVNNPFEWKTRREVIAMLADAGGAELIGLTTSCARVRTTTRACPHCGICSQCIDRRFGVLAARQEAHDPSDGYEVDLLVGERAEGPAKTMLAIYVEMATAIGKMGVLDFFRKYGEAARVLIHTGDSVDAAAANVFNLYRRHAQAIRSVIDEAFGRYATKIRERTLPPGCLLRMVFDAGGTAVVAEPSSNPPEPNLFRKNGAAWVVRFAGGKDFTLLPSRGASYLAVLFAQPGIAISATALAATVAKDPSLNVLGDAGPAADKETLRTCQARLDEIRTELDEAHAAADEAMEDRLLKEQSDILTYIRQVLRPDGVIQTDRSDRIRISKAVGVALGRVVDAIRAYHPPLAEHLDSTLRCGATPVYDPGDHVRWEL